MIEEVIREEKRRDNGYLELAIVMFNAALTNSWNFSVSAPMILSASAVVKRFSTIVGAGGDAS